MACKCKDKTAIIRCKKCGRMQTINYGKNQNPLEIAKRNGRKCKFDYSEEFELANR